MNTNTMNPDTMNTDTMNTDTINTDTMNTSIEIIPSLPIPSFGLSDNNSAIEPPKGTFEYVKDINTRDMLINCWQAITLTETWEFIKKDPGEYGFMGSNAPEIYTIHSKMEELPNQVGHTGFSFTWTLRQMQYLANNGEESYKQLVLKNT